MIAALVLALTLTFPFPPWPGATPPPIIGAAVGIGADLPDLDHRKDTHDG